ncbi:MAG: ABC transporter ATP-binding protein, partial [Daejeonella sp.]
LILDEPTSGLDPNQVTGIRNLIKELGKTKTIIFSTHIMQEVEAVCDQVIIINKGQIVADDLLTSLKTAYKLNTLEDIFRQVTA